jgi:hypothetical protein
MHFKKGFFSPKYDYDYEFGTMGESERTTYDSLLIREHEKTDELLSIQTSENSVRLMNSITLINRIEKIAKKSHNKEDGNAKK